MVPTRTTSNEDHVEALGGVFGRPDNEVVNTIGASSGWYRDE